MADNQYGPQSKFFMQPPAGTGAPGSAGVSAADELPDSDWRVNTTPAGQTTQDPSGLDMTSVGRDDVNTMNESALYSSGTDPLTGLDHTQLSSTGAGQGHADHFAAGRGQS